MENNIPTLYILEFDSSVVKSAKLSTILCLFVQKIKKTCIDRIAMGLRTQTSSKSRFSKFSDRF